MRQGRGKQEVPSGCCQPSPAPHIRDFRPHGEVGDGSTGKGKKGKDRDRRAGAASVGSYIIRLLSAVAGRPRGSGMLAVATPAGALSDDGAVAPPDGARLDALMVAGALMPAGGVKSSASAAEPDNRSASGISAESLVPSCIPRTTLRLLFCGSSSCLPACSFPR